MSRLTLDLSPETDKRLTEIATKKGITKVEALRRAFALLSIAEEQQKEGNYLGIVKGDNTLISRLVGV
jgi:predicted transcriptional regulator